MARHKTKKKPASRGKGRRKTAKKNASRSHRVRRASSVKATATAPKRRRRKRKTIPYGPGHPLYARNMRLKGMKQPKLSATDKAIARHRRRHGNKMRAVTAAHKPHPGINPELRARLGGDWRDRLAALRARQGAKAQAVASIPPSFGAGLSAYKARQRDRLIGSRASD